MIVNWVEKLNQWGSQKKPCFFLIDYSTKRGEVFSLNELNNEEIAFAFPHYKSIQNIKKSKVELNLNKNPIDFNIYQKSYQNVINHLNRGDSYLVNLTFPTPIDLNVDINDLFHLIAAPYKILYQKKWLCFSPETFIQISNNQVATFPMKGTIDAKIPHAESVLKNDFKEVAEHSTVVDLLRNDLSLISKNVRVKRLMFTEKVITHQGDILQMISEIVGDLQHDWHLNLGNILHQLLPAGSICGAPKKKTIQIINESENYDRGFYTGIAGFFDGESLDTCVLIRFIENTPSGLVYKSGGGITALSDVQKEYNELNQKIYVPVS